MSAKAISTILANHKAKKLAELKKEKQVESDSDETMSLDGERKTERPESPEMGMPQLLSSQFEILKEEPEAKEKVLSKKNTDALLRMAKTPIAEESPSSDDSMPKKQAEKPKVVKYCNCRKGTRPAREATTKKAGPNFGKVFYSCDRPMDDDDNCGYFEWAPTEADRQHGVFCKCRAPGVDDDDDQDESSSEDEEDDDDGSKAMAKRLAKNKKRDESRVPAVRQQVKKPGPNCGRFFFSCRLGKSKSGCEFFQWDDKTSKSDSKPVSKPKRKLDSSSDDDDDDDDGTF